VRLNNWDSNARPDPDAESGENASGQITPIESVISAKDSKNLHRQAELSEQIIEERQKRAAEPVHMEGLRPLPPEIRATLPGPGQLPGGPDALGLAPGMRRSVPAPFKRDRIAVDHHGKSWAYAPAWSVQPGDIVVDFGKIAENNNRITYKDISEVVVGEVVHLSSALRDAGGEQVAVGTDYLLVNIDGKEKVVSPTDQLRVFRVHEGDG
jgi:hypothetical protein